MRNLVSVIGDILIRRWDIERRAFDSLLAEVHADEVHTVAVRLFAKQIDSDEGFAASLERYSKKDRWAACSTSASAQTGKAFGFALPVPPNAPHASLNDSRGIVFVEFHTWLSAWWLMYAWRAKQLANAARELASAGHDIAAAACARSLVETAAAVWVDADKIAKVWGELKKTGIMDPDAFEQYCNARNVVYNIVFGSKFKSPDQKALWNNLSGGDERVNVLTQLSKLAKATHSGIQEDYDWLCNTVHPSLGNLLTFASPPFLHSSGTHSIHHFHEKGLYVESDSGKRDAENTIQIIIARAITSSLEVLAVTLDAALHVVDDVALTTEAPTLSVNPYWRDIKRSGRNDSCPCRSKRKSKDCHHRWGDPAPSIPARPVRG